MPGVRDEPPVTLDTLHAAILALPPGPLVTWFLDVDGVLNLQDGEPAPPRDWPAYRRAVVGTRPGA